MQKFRPDPYFFSDLRAIPTAALAFRCSNVLSAIASRLACCPLAKLVFARAKAIAPDAAGLGAGSKWNSGRQSKRFHLRPGPVRRQREPTTLITHKTNPMRILAEPTAAGRCGAVRCERRGCAPALQRRGRRFLERSAEEWFGGWRHGLAGHSGAKAREGAAT
jgi:hypothetical protein